MKPSYRERALAATVVLALAGFSAAGCQTTESASSNINDAPGRAFRERRGWVVDYVAASDGAKWHCRGRRAAATSGPGVVFIGAEAESGFRIVGLPAAQAATRQIDIVAQFDNGDRQSFTGRREGDAVAIMTPTGHYEDFMHPFGRARSVSINDQRGEQIATMSLNGSSWAINATDECRRMHALTRIR